MTPIPFKTYVQFYHTAAWNTCEDVLQDPGPVWEYGLPGAGILDLVADTGTLTFTLDNSTGNAAGLAGYYTVGHANCPAWFVDGLPVRVRCERQDDMTVATRFVGNIVASRPTSGLYLEQTVEVEARDWMDFAHSQKMGTIGIELNTRAGAAITKALTKCGVQPTATDLDVGLELWDYMFNSDDSLSMSVASLLQKIARNEGGGWIYVKGNGTLTFDNRSVRELAAQAFALDPVHELETAFDRNDVINKLEIEVHPRYMDAAATTVIWELREPFAIAAGETVKLTCPYRDPDTGARISALDVVDPLIPAPYCTGGTVTTIGGKRIHTFTGDGTLVVVNPGDVDYLIVGGGGGGAAGGGGAGGYLTGTDTLTAGNKAVVIGGGGAGVAAVGAAGTAGAGGDTTFNGHTAKGGGGGGVYKNLAGGTAGAGGGSGGGGSLSNTTTWAGGAATGVPAGQGNAGGTNGGFLADKYPSGGGGGAGAVGGNAPSLTNSGPGGAGLNSSLSGAAVGYAGGGGGGTYNGAGGVGGTATHGGGAGAAGATGGTVGTTNRGGGGGGSGNGGTGGTGGSGIVIVSYDDATMSVKYGSVDDGSTNDLIASLTATQETGGNTDVITLTAAVAGYVNFLEIIGRGIYDYEPMVSTAEDATSIAAYGDRPLSVDLEQVSNPSTARIMGNYYLTLFKSPQQRIDRVRFLANYDDDYATAALTVEPNVKFGITESLSATTNDYFATRLRFEAVGPLLWVEILPAIDPTTAGTGAGVNWFYWDVAGHGWDEGQWVF